jgi:hypothetical protein
LLILKISLSLNESKITAMKNQHNFWIITISILLISSSCSNYSHLTDDDVYVISAPTLTSTEQINDESSYENYKYNKNRQINEPRYGVSFFRGSAVYHSSRYGFRSFGSHYRPGGMFFSSIDNAFYSYNYNNYYGYVTYPGWYYDDFNGYGYLLNECNNIHYGSGFFNGPYCNNNFYVINNNPTNQGNKIYKARATISGMNSPRRMGTPSSSIAGMKTKPSNSSKYSESYRANARINSKTTSNNTKVVRAVESGVGLSKQGVRVSTNGAGSTRIANSPAVNRNPSPNSKNAIERTKTPSNNNASPRLQGSPSKSSSSPGRRLN